VQPGSCEGPLVLLRQLHRYRGYEVPASLGQHGVRVPVGTRLRPAITHVVRSQRYGCRVWRELEVIRGLS